MVTCAPPYLDPDQPSPNATKYRRFQRKLAKKVCKTKIFRLYIEKFVEFGYAPASEELRVIPRGAHGLSCVAKLLFDLR
jgi:hypothetical protein